MTWSCITVKKPSVSAKKSAFVSHLFDASMSTYCWLSSYGWRPCKAFWDHCLLTLFLYSSPVGSSFSCAWTNPSGVLLLLLLLLLLLYDMYVSCHRPFLSGIYLEPAMIPTAPASSFTLQYFPYYV